MHFIWTTIVHSMDQMVVLTTNHFSAIIPKRVMAYALPLAADSTSANGVSSLHTRV